jgi:hypothetical protein
VPEEAGKPFKVAIAACMRTAHRPERHDPRQQHLEKIRYECLKFNTVAFELYHSIATCWSAKWDQLLFEADLH